MEVVVTTGLLELWVVQSSSQIVTTNKPTSSFFYRPDALPVSQPTVSKHWRELQMLDLFCSFAVCLLLQRRCTWETLVVHCMTASSKCCTGLMSAQNSHSSSRHQRHMLSLPVRLCDVVNVKTLLPPTIEKVTFFGHVLSYLHLDLKFSGWILLWDMAICSDFEYPHPEEGCQR